MTLSTPVSDASTPSLPHSSASDSAAALLRVEGLRVQFRLDGGRVARAVDGVSFAIATGETLGLVGESGCGKSVASLSLLGLLPMPPAEVAGGAALFDGDDLLKLRGAALRARRGRDVAMIFQEPMTSLNPVFTVGDQVTEAVRCHEAVAPEEAWGRARDAFADVGLPDPERLLGRYPHELSGGMKQRVMIAMALVCRPRLLICDEPTTALDVTIQAQILDLLRRLQRERGMAMLFITHNLGVVAELAHRVAVMYAGKIVETAAAEPLFARPLHPYTRGLFNSLPRLGGPRKALVAIPGMVPEPFAFPEGCRFHPRCGQATERCRREAPVFEEKAPDHWCACHYAERP